MVEGSAAAWFGALGSEVTVVEEVQDEVVVGVQTPDGQVVLCGSCGRRARSKGRREVVLRDTPGSDGRPVSVRWKKRVWECRDPRCGAGPWTEQSASWRARAGCSPAGQSGGGLAGWRRWRVRWRRRPAVWG